MESITRTLGPRIPLNPNPNNEMQPLSAVHGMQMPSRMTKRFDHDKKPITMDSIKVPIILGIVIPLVCIAVALLFLHRRNVKKQRKEDLEDPHKELDFGMGDKSTSTVSKLRKSILGLGGEKPAPHKHQISMDMNMSTPYLLPPQLQSSRESLHSLTRSIQNNEDPYRPVAHYAGSDVGSIRSLRRGPGQEQASVYAASTLSGTRDMPSRQNSMPRSPPPVADPFRHPMTGPEPTHSPTATTVSDPFQSKANSTTHSDYSTPYPDEKMAPMQSKGLEMPDVQPSTDEAPKLPAIDRSLSPDDRQNPPPQAFAAPMSATFEFEAEEPAAKSQLAHPASQQAQVEDVRDYASTVDDPNFARPHAQELDNASHHPVPQAQSAVAQVDDRYSGSNYQADYPVDYVDFDEEPRGRAPLRAVDEAQRGSQFLAAPNADSKRLSVGYRPLPPGEITESEDPEYRANRIRSFYKEYFEDKNTVHPPLPELPPQAMDRQSATPAPLQPQSAQPNEYYEDYDGAYLENTFYDPGSNAFVMPYAQPVTRRAMTPPPSRAPRMRGPPPPRGVHGSIGGMSMRGGPFRPGSATSSRYGPRPGSSASARVGPRGRPVGPPPAALTTLPNPAKLTDDSFALLSATDFAPPDNFKDQAAGRSQSPVPEKRPYHMPIPSHTPLASSFDDLAAIPSPHLLRKSSTFTGLDFAPPKRFKDNGDTMSDSGSIRSYTSNRSGISPMNNAAIRSGAGRVSRLPTDTVFTQAQLHEQLKPTWNVRP